MLFFWCSVFAFKRWAGYRKLGRFSSPANSISPGLQIREHNISDLLPVPLLAWPDAHEKHCRRKVFISRLFVGIVGHSVIFVLAGLVIFSGGAVKQNSLLPSAEFDVVLHH